ncbi:hypothetical protein S83_070286, partial [Arachis hypogaea]
MDPSLSHLPSPHPSSPAAHPRSIAEPTKSPPRRVAQRQSPPRRHLPPLSCSALVGLVQLFFTKSLPICF